MNLLLVCSTAAAIAFAAGFVLAFRWQGRRLRAQFETVASDWQRRVDATKREIATRTRMFEDTESRRSTLQLRIDMAEAELTRAQDRIAELEGRWQDFGYYGKRVVGGY